MTQAAPLRVLVVEDEALIAMLIEDMLADAGHLVAATAGRLPQALQIASTAEFDFAIIDVNLNGELSYPLAELLRARGVPFVFASGYGAGGLSADWTGWPVLQKPFQPDELQAAMRRLLGV